MIAHTRACTTLSFNPIGDILATGSSDKTIRLWSTKKMNEIAILRNKSHSICQIAFSLDNQYLLACSTDHRLTLYNIQGKIRQTNNFIGHQD